MTLFRPLTNDLINSQRVTIAYLSSFLVSYLQHQCKLKQNSKYLSYFLYFEHSLKSKWCFIILNLQLLILQLCLDRSPTFYVVLQFVFAYMQNICHLSFCLLPLEYLWILILKILFCLTSENQIGSCHKRSAGWVFSCEKVVVVVKILVSGTVTSRRNNCILFKICSGLNSEPCCCPGMCQPQVCYQIY